MNCFMRFVCGSMVRFVCGLFVCATLRFVVCHLWFVCGPMVPFVTSRGISDVARVFSDVELSERLSHVASILKEI